MGLAGPRKRRKIGNDPNNTAWSSSETTFGHRMLTSQGWTPGNYLGAADAAHASHYTAASQAHVRVLHKDDNLGIGAARAQQEGKEFGLLGGFQDLLGRLNGKDEVKLGQEQQARADIGRKMYAEMKWGPARFVRGGFLVGDRIEEVVPVAEIVVKEEDLSESTDGIVNKPKKEETDTKSGKIKKERKVKIEKLEDEQMPEASSGNPPETKEERQHRRQARKAEKEARRQALALKEENATSSDNENRNGETKAERKQRRLEKRARKEAKRISKASQTTLPAQLIQVKAEDPQEIPYTPTPIATGISTPNSGVRTPSTGGGLAVRQRYLKQKRMASMDPRALREILMLKS